MPSVLHNDGFSSHQSQEVCFLALDSYVEGAHHLRSGTKLFPRTPDFSANPEMIQAHLLRQEGSEAEFGDMICPRPHN